MMEKKTFNKKIVMIGFGAIGQAVLPLMLRHIVLDLHKFIIITDSQEGQDIAQKHGIDFEINELFESNYKQILDKHIEEGCFLLNVSVRVSSIDLIKYCDKKGALYLDLSLETWSGESTDCAIPACERTNYAYREQSLELKNMLKTTAVVTQGANPGLVSALTKQALLNIAKDNGLMIDEPRSRQEWAKLAYDLDIKVIHVAERDTQTIAAAFNPHEFVNTWSVEGLIEESLQPAELGWGTHERHFPHKAYQYEFGCKAAIYIEKPGASVRVRTWCPTLGAFHGFLITHAESISIADYLSYSVNEETVYRPTVHYAYLPSPYTVLSLDELASHEWQVTPELKLRVMRDDILEGTDELGVLLMGNKKGAYWYGSSLNIHEARQLAPYNSATSLQVAAGMLAGILWAIDHPFRGLIEPDDLDFKYVLEVATPYLGTLSGHYTDWTPLQNRELLFEEKLDKTDPWQFINILVD